MLELSSPEISVLSAPISEAGQSVSLSCIVTVVENLIVNPHIEWMKVGSSTFNDQNSTEMNTVVSGTVSTLNVSFDPLLTSHAGQYQCRASINISDVVPVVFNNITTSLYVASKFLL